MDTQKNYKFDFNFKNFYQSIDGASAGLQLYLAQKLLENTSDQMTRSQRKYRSKTESLANAIEELRDERNQDYFEKRYGSNETNLRSI